MTELNLPTVSNGDFYVGPADGALPGARFSGTGDMEAADELCRFLSLLHEQALKAETKTIFFQVDELYFMNSSCLKELIVWIGRINTAGRPYTVSFVTNPRLQWQERSLGTLQRLAPAVVTIAA